MKKILLLLFLLSTFLTVSSCGKGGKPCNHDHTIPATCTTGTQCSKCGEILGVANGHNWAAATCTKPKTCKVCNITEGITAEHDWYDATCSKPKTCSVCYKTTGYTVEHKYNAGYCIWCNKKDPTYLDITNNNILTIGQINWDINSVGGVEVDVTFTNQSKKQIAYVYFTIKFYDRMGSPAICDIKHTHTQRLKYTGPVNAGATKTGYWDPLIYNSTTAAIKPLSIEIIYTDGTKQIINNPGRYWYSKLYYGGDLKD